MGTEQQGSADVGAVGQAGAVGLSTTSLTVRFRRHAVLSDLTVRADRGVVALVGPNGSGKTTLLRVLATLRRPDGGAVSLGGHDLTTARGAMRARRELGFLPQDPEPLAHLRVDEAIAYAAWLKGVPRRQRAGRVGEMLDTLDLAAVSSNRLRSLSGGTRQRAHLAQAMVHQPRVLLLDEPSTGVDAEHRVDLRATLRRVAHGRLVVLSTHLTEDIELLADRVLALESGRLRFDGTPGELAQLAGQGDCDEPARAIERGLRSLGQR
jgi:ABC-2 type transport system ATP-binding protein